MPITRRIRPSSLCHRLSLSGRLKPRRPPSLSTQRGWQRTRRQPKPKLRSLRRVNPPCGFIIRFQSPVAAKNAKSLATRIGAELTRSDFKAESDLPKHAAIRISEERNRALARTIGQSLGDLGYEWEIENLSGLTQSRRNVIEVWLPAK